MGGAESNDDPTKHGQSDDQQSTDAESSDHLWHSSGVGAFVVGVDVLLIGAIVVGTTGALSGLFEVLGVSVAALPGVRVPAYVYLYATFGALTYVFTRLVRDVDRSTKTLLHSNVRVLAALPLAAGFYLLADRFLGTGPASGTLAGLSFLTGLFVNTAYYRINALGKRLFPASELEQSDDHSTGSARKKSPGKTQPSAPSPPSGNAGGSKNGGGSGTPSAADAQQS